MASQIEPAARARIQLTEAARLAICVATHERRIGAHRAIESAASQSPDVEVVVVSNGDEAHAASLRAAYPHLDVLEVPNFGLSDARNTGAAAARAEWLAFLDDDDRLLPGWFDHISQVLDDDVGVASCGARKVSEAGARVAEHTPDESVELLGDVQGVHYAGAFVVRRSVFEEAGGYLPGLPVSHQTELWIRMIAVCEKRSLRTASVPMVLSEVTVRDSTARPMSTPRQLYDGARWLLTRHASHFDGLPKDRANLAGIVGVSAARLGFWAEARKYSLRAARWNARSPLRWARLVCANPWLGPRAWKAADHFEASAHATSLRTVRRIAGEQGTTSDLLFLPWGYRENPNRSADASGDPFWREGTEANDVRYQAPVYRWLAGLLRSGRAAPPVLDVGCGSGHKLVEFVGPLTNEVWGVDQGSGIDLAKRTFPDRNWLTGDLTDDALWQRLHQLEPRLVICSDVIEHLPDPYQLLDNIRGLLGRDGLAVISTPDRSRLEGRPPLGPPGNPRHIREWNHDEFELLLAAAGLEVVRARHFLPRRYSPTPTDAKRVIYRALHRRAIPDRRNSMAFLVTPA